VILLTANIQSACEMRCLVLDMSMKPLFFSFTDVLYGPICTYMDHLALLLVECVYVFVSYIPAVAVFHFNFFTK